MVKEVGDLKMSEFMCSIWVLFTKSKKKTQYEETANERLSHSPTPGITHPHGNGLILITSDSSLSLQQGPIVPLFISTYNENMTSGHKIGLSC